MRIQYDTHYDADYFTGRKRYLDPAGVEQTYHGPALEWEGFVLLGDILGTVLPGPGTLLDIGCSAGDLAANLGRHGYDPFGVEISKYAVERAVPTMKGRIALADITTVEGPLQGHGEGGLAFPSQFDLVMATDLLEHIYQEDLERTFQWMLSVAKKWMFFCVAITRGEEFIHKKGEDVPARWRTTAVSGHVNVLRPGKWARFFKEHGLKIRYDLAYLFQALREENPALQATGGWSHWSTWVLEKK